MTRIADRGLLLWLQGWPEILNLIGDLVTLKYEICILTPSLLNSYDQWIALVLYSIVIAMTRPTNADSGLLLWLQGSSQILHLIGNLVTLKCKSPKSTSCSLLNGYDCWIALVLLHCHFHGMVGQSMIDYLLASPSPISLVWLCILPISRKPAPAKKVTTHGTINRLPYKKYLHLCKNMRSSVISTVQIQVHWPQIFASKHQDELIPPHR